jgi:sulfonate transport system substrate-binding protein
MICAPMPLYYTRCPVPTASGIAFQHDLFEPLFAGTGYEVRNLQELGDTHRDAHYTHSIEQFFREGGGSPPMWARSRGVDSVLLGITFMEELLGIYVRTEDAATTVADLADRRFALPVWPRLVFNFWRFAAEKGIASALRVHGLTEADVRLVDVTEDWDPHERRQVGRVDAVTPARCEYRAQLEALLSGEVDAIFGKGPEAALLEREAGGRVRLLYDLRSAPDLRARVNNSTPRLLTTGRSLLDGHPNAVVTYLRAVLHAGRWALMQPDAARRLIARECAVDDAQLETCLQPNYAEELLPSFSARNWEATQIMQEFLLTRGYLEREFQLDTWADSGPLNEACALEGLDLQQFSQNRDEKTFRELDLRNNWSKGTAFRRFKALLPVLAEGEDFHRLAADSDALKIDELRVAGRIYASTVHAVLLRARACALIESG